MHIFDQRINIIRTRLLTFLTMYNSTDSASISHVKMHTNLFCCIKHEFCQLVQVLHPGIVSGGTTSFYCSNEKPENAVKISAMHKCVAVFNL